MHKKLIFLFLAVLCSCSAYPAQRFIKEYSEEPIVYFCPADDCPNILSGYINRSESSIHCTFFNIDIPEILALLDNKSEYVDVKLTIDNTNKIKFSSYNIVFDSTSQLSHNKFCIFDSNIVFTGSFNPTESEVDNNNNIIIIKSKKLAENYEYEFNELLNYNFGKGRQTLDPVIYINNKKYENYFCPEDSCQEKVLRELSKAKECIYFMTFSFTDYKISSLLVDKKKKNLDIKGVFESKRYNMQYEQYQYLNRSLILLKPDNNSPTMHHKVFIVDNRTVITGSYNPTGAANEKNDENLLIINNHEIANKYLEEFNRLFVTNQE